MLILPNYVLYFKLEVSRGKDSKTRDLNGWGSLLKQSSLFENTRSIFLVYFNFFYIFFIGISQGIGLEVKRIKQIPEKQYNARTPTYHLPDLLIKQKNIYGPIWGMVPVF